MLTTFALMEKLLEIERAIGHTDNAALRNLLMDAETQVLQVERDLIKVMLEIRRIRETREPLAARAQAADSAQPREGSVRRARKPAFAM